MKFTHVLFDLDGTLTDPGIGITNSIIYALKKYGINPPDRSELYSFIGPPLVDSFMKKYGMSEDDAKLNLKYYREYFSVTGMFENVKYDGIDSMLTELKNNGVKLIIATSKPDLYTIQILKKFGLYDYFDFISANTMDEIRSDKKLLIENAVSSLGFIPSKKIAMVGDRKYDVEGGNFHGLTSVGVTYGYGSEEELKNAGADIIAHSVNELRNILLG